MCSYVSLSNESLSNESLSNESLFTWCWYLFIAKATVNKKTRKLYIDGKCYNKMTESCMLKLVNAASLVNCLVD